MIKKGDIINVVVKDFAFGGKGIATYKVDDKCGHKKEKTNLFRGRDN